MSATTRDRYVARKRLHAAVRRAGKKHAAWDAARTGRFALVLTPGSVATKAVGWARGKAGAGNSHQRGIVRGWSDRSKRRFRMRIASIAWPLVRFVFVTSTYPAEFPRDPKIWKAHLHELAVAWRKKWGPALGAWVLEFQARGAPHFHSVLVAPPGVEIDELRRWYAATWHRIVTGCVGDHDRGRGLAETCVPWHYERHTADEHCKFASDAREAIGYLMNELGKESQKTLPAYLDHQCDESCATDCAVPCGAGRWWGVWGLEPDEQEIGMSKREYLAVRHAMIRLGREVAKRQHARRERTRLWKLAHGKRWTPRPRPPGRWLSPRSLHEGLTVMDPELRPYVFAKAFRALLAEIRRPANVRAFGSRDPIVSVLDRLDRARPAVLFP